MNGTTELGRAVLRALVCAVVVVTACDNGGVSVGGGRDGGKAGGAGGAQTDGGGGSGAGGAGGDAGGGGAAGSGGAAGDGGVVVDPTDPANPTKDSDCDGLNDAEELGTTYAGGGRTNPGVADSDGDGITDGVELGRTTSVDSRCSFTADQDPATRTNPTLADSDGDGVGDGVEDTNKNGRRDANETDPSSVDSDGDGLSDGVEDHDKDGVVDPTETDPRRRDTDMDGIADGVERRVTMTDPTKADTDNDMCSDGAEDANQNGMVDMGETNPNLATDCGPVVNPDGDMDGIPNRLEDRNGNGMVDPGETNPMSVDTDMDGLNDGVEDANRNGLFDAGETNATKKDTDCDGLLDGPAQGMIMGEDANANGMVDSGETDPRRRDTDGDGLTDGVERGLTTARIADPTGCTAVAVDAEPTTTTNPNARDSDGDQIDDGAEDVNQNGRVDMGELNPNDMADGSGPAGQACARTNLRPVVFHPVPEADLQLGLPATFTELAQMRVGGATKGVIGFDGTTNVAFLAWRQPAPGSATNPTADETALRPTVAGVGALTNVTTQTFTSWDNVPALQLFADQAGTTDLKSRANALAAALVGTGAGALTGTGGGAGPFRLQLEVLHRANGAVVFVLALSPLSVVTATGTAALFTMADTAGGSAVAQFGDTNAVQCETFAAGNANVDFLLVVDDSCSMADSQGALAAAAANIASALNNSSLNWRIALATSAYADGSGSGGNETVVRGFTRDINQVRSWLTENSTCSGSTCTGVTPTATCWGSGANSGCWVGIGGTGTEKILASGARALTTLTPTTAVEQAGKIRTGALVAMVVLGDADDQSGNTPAQFTTFFSTLNATLGSYTNRVGRVVVHGITCANGKICNAERAHEGWATYVHNDVIAATGGVRGDICEPGTAADANCSSYPSIPGAVQNIVNSVIAQAGYRMQKPPIGASVKVAMGSVLTPAMCNKDDLPRSRANGFDFDGVNRTISLFGACRAPMAGVIAAVSYRYWQDNTPNLGGGPPPCQGDMFFDATDPDFCRGRLQCNITANVCECPANCGGAAPAGKVCNTNRLVCDFVCTADCGGTCTSFQTCNTTSCGCECQQNATCPVGYRFQNGAGVCGCVCDTTALNCSGTRQADTNACACVCKPNCGGCPAGETCNPSTCVCLGGIN